jgi:serine/threonine-protein kinase
VRDHLTAIDPKSGAARFAAAAAVIDRYTRGLGDMHVEACRATRVQGRQSDTLYDLRMRCLDRRRAELSAALALVADAPDTTRIDRAVAALSQLTPLDGCADANALGRAAPEAPDARRIADEIARERDAIETASRAGRFDGLLARAQTLVARADELGHAPSQATALEALATVQREVGERAALVTTLERLTQVAAQAHDDRAAARAWTKLLGAISYDKGKPKDARAIVPAARAAVLRAGDDDQLRVELLFYEAMVLESEHALALASARLDDARQILERGGATASGSPLLSRLGDVELEAGSVHANAEDYDGAVAAYRRAIERFRQAYGADHPDEAWAWFFVGEALRHQGKLEEALAAYREAARIRQARLGETLLLAFSTTAIGFALVDLGRYQEAVPPLEHALQVYRTRAGTGDLHIAAPLIAIGAAYVHVDRRDDARRAYSEAIAVLDGTAALNLPFALSALAELDTAQGHCATALVGYRRARGLLETLRGSTTHYLISPLLGEGRCLVRLGRAGVAIALLERALSIPSPGGNKEEQADARFYLGRALVESGRGRARGLALARAARLELAKLGAGAADELRDADAWLARRR